MVLKNGDQSGEPHRATDSSGYSHEGDGSPSANNGVGCQLSSLPGMKTSLHSSPGCLEIGVEATNSTQSYASKAAEMLLNSNSRVMSAEKKSLYSRPSLASNEITQDGDDSSGDGGANDVIEAACSSDRVKDDNVASCGLGTTNSSGLRDDCQTNFGSPRLPYDSVEHFQVKKHDPLLEASSSQQISQSGEKCHDQDVKVIKSNQRIESAPPEDDLDVEEEDVKVCDICGDTGREDLLAVCSSCSDGAEHTYCMRDKLDKVPEGDWVCEECKSCEVVEARKRNHPKKLASDERGKYLGRTSSLRADLSVKLDYRDPLHNQNKRKSVGLNKQSSSRILGERMEPGSTAKSLGWPSSPSHVPVYSKDRSFKNLNKMKGKPSNQISTGSESTGESSEDVRSPTTNSVHVLKGNFVKSNSFSSKQNVMVSEDILQSQKQTFDAKDGPGKLIGKSTSFKGLGRSSVGEPKVKMLSPKCAPVQDLKGQKHGRDRISFERKHTMKFDSSFSTQTAPNPSKRPSRGPDGISSLSVANNRDYKIVQTDGKLTTVSKHADRLAHKSLDASTNLGEIRRPSCVSMVGPTLADGIGNLADANPDQSTVKDRSTLTDCSLGVEEARIDKEDSQSEKTLENSGGRSRQGLDGAVPSGNRRGISLDASASKTKECLHEENKLKAAIEAAMQKKLDIFKKNKIPEKLDELSMSKAQGNNGGDAVLSKVRVSIAEDAMHIEDSGHLDSASNSCKQITMSSTKQLRVYPAGSSIYASQEPVLTVSAIPEQEFVWQGGFEIHRNGKVPDMCGGFQAHISSFASCKVLEVVRKFPTKIVLNEVPRPCAWPVQFKEFGAQEDHIALYFFAKDIDSYTRSYRILVEYMMKHDLALKGKINGVELLVFPSNQLPHKSQCWNTLFFMWGVFRGRKPCCSEDTLGSLGMSKSSISSTVQTGKDASQNPCLNKAAAADSSVSGGGCAAVYVCESPGVGSSALQSVSLSNGSCRTVDCSQTSLASSSRPERSEKRPTEDYGGSGEECPESSWSAGLKDHCQQKPDTISVGQNSTAEIDRGNNHAEAKILSPELMLDKQHNSSLSSEAPLMSKLKVDIDATSEDQGLLVVGSNNVDVVKSENSWKQGDQSVYNTHSYIGQVKIKNDINDKDGIDYLMKNDRAKDGGLRQEEHVDINVAGKNNAEELDGQYSPKRHSHGSSFESISPAASVITCQRRTRSDSLDMPEDGDQACLYKRVKGADSLYGCDRYGHLSFGDSLGSRLCGVSASSSKQETFNEAGNKRSTLTNPGSVEGCSFLVNPLSDCGALSGDGTLPVKVALSANEDRLPDGSPNLELALGVKKKQSQEGTAPFFPGVVDRKDAGRPLDIKSPKEADGDASASLSLSLAFPF